MNWKANCVLNMIENELRDQGLLRAMWLFRKNCRIFLEEYRKRMTRWVHVIRRTNRIDLLKIPRLVEIQRVIAKIDIARAYGNPA
jgi:hypothetical protein